MTKKTFLSKVLPALLVFVLVLLFVVVISSCSRTKKTPNGSIENIDDYISVTLTDGEKVLVSKTDFYNQLRYIGYDGFTEELERLIFAEQVTAIESDLDANKADLSGSKYYDDFVDIINNATYQTTDQDKIDELTNKELEQFKTKLFSDLRSFGCDIDETKGIYQEAVIRYYLVNLAKKEYARSVLIEDIAEVDGKYEITDEDIAKYYDENLKDRDDVSALVILFSSDDEIEESLKALKLKFVKDKLYRVPSTGALNEDYNETYDNFSATADGVSHLEDNEVLFEFARIYNYVYGEYRTKLTLLTDGVNDMLAKTTYTAEDYTTIKNTPIATLRNLLIAQDKSATDEFPRITYEYDKINKYDSSICSTLYTKIFTDSTRYLPYNTSASSYKSGKFLAFKLADSQEGTYDNIKSLANFVDAIANNNSTASINAYIQELREIYETRLRALNIFDDSAAIKEYFYGNGTTTGYANTIKANGVVGAKNIIASAWDKTNDESVFSEVFEALLTDDYINEKVSDFIEDECKIVIYDELFEVQFANKFSSFKTSNKQSKENVASVKINGNTTYLTTATLYTKLEKKYGAATALRLLSNQVLKEKYYNLITEDEKTKYKEDYDSALTYFAAGQSASLGYPASYGQKAFMQLYFHADNKEDAIFNMWAVQRLQEILLYEQPTDIYSTLFKDFADLTKLIKQEYVHFAYQAIRVYTDDDEDGVADDWTKVDSSSSAALQARKAEVEEYTALLMNVISNEIKALNTSSQSTGYSQIASAYSSASRISSSYVTDGGTIPTFASTEEKNAYLYGKFKQKGLFITSSNNSIDSYDALDKLDDDYLIEQMKNIYKWGKSLIINNVLSVDFYIAQKLTLNDENEFVGADEKIANKNNLCISESGYWLIFVTDAENEPSAEFKFADNANDSSNGKVYPYSIDAENPFPKDEDGNPIDSYTDENTLYNDTKDATANQIAMYIREYVDGVESLSDSVTTALDTFFKDKVYSYFISSAYSYTLYYDLVTPYITAGKITFSNADLQASIASLVDAQQDAVFNYETSDFVTAWWNIFK